MFGCGEGPAGKEKRIEEVVRSVWCGIDPRPGLSGPGPIHALIQRGGPANGTEDEMRLVADAGVDCRGRPRGFRGGGLFGADA